MPGARWVMHGGCLTFVVTLSLEVRWSGFKRDMFARIAIYGQTPGVAKVVLRVRFVFLTVIDPKTQTLLLLMMISMEDARPGAS